MLLTPYSKSSVSVCLHIFFKYYNEFLIFDLKSMLVECLPAHLVSVCSVLLRLLNSVCGEKSTVFSVLGSSHFEMFYSPARLSCTSSRIKLIQ